MRLLGIAPICLTCQRFLGVESAAGYVCEAFAGGVPTDVLASRVDHRDPVEGDGGLRYRPKAEQDEAGYCAVSKDDMRCEGCQRYQQPNGCKIVAGQISPLGWCPGYEASAGVRADSVVAQLQPSVAADAEFQESDHPRGEDGKFTEGAGGGLSPAALTEVTKAATKDISWDKPKNGRVTVVRGGKGFATKVDTGPKFFTTQPDIAVNYSDDGRDPISAYSIDRSKLLIVEGSDWIKKFGDKYGDEIGPDLFASPPREVLEYIKSRGLTGFALSDGSYIRVEKSPEAGIRWVKDYRDTLKRADSAAGELVKAAGIMFVTKDGKVLVLRRVEDDGRPGKWAFPGGKLEDGETPEQTAVREADEEIGEYPDGIRRLWMRRVKDGVDFTTFLQVVDEPFTPTLNDEHDAYEWIDGHGLAAVARSAARRDEANFKESDHNRDSDGKFASMGAASKHFIKQFHHHDYEIIQRHFGKTGSTERKTLAHRMMSAAPELVKAHFREEKGKAINAANAMKSLALGRRPSPDELRGLRQFGLSMALSTASFLTHGDPTGAVGHVATEFLSAIVEHTILEHGAKVGAGSAHAVYTALRQKLARRDDADGDDYGMLLNFVDHIIDAIENAEIEEDPESRADAEFQESEHPRGQPDNPGQFVKGAGGAKSAHLVDAPDRDKWPAHIKKLKLPPAWHSVRVSEDPKASLQAVGYDSKNRPQYVYSARFSESQTAKKFARIKSLDSKFERVLSQNQRCLNSKDPVRREHALVTSLVLEMGLRPGSERETGAAEKAYGATTLRSEHVLSDSVDTFLRFTGKKGVKLLLKVEDPALAKELKARSRKTKDQLFPEVTAASLRSYIGSLGGGGFKTKDMRTLKATRLATDLVASEAPPKSEAAYKRAVREVATKVAKVLGNTPTVCLQSYIPPEVFAPWRGAVGGAEARADADWKEEDHPRGQPGNAGQFGPGGGGAAKPAEETKAAEPPRSERSLKAERTQRHATKQAPKLATKVSGRPWRLRGPRGVLRDNSQRAAQGSRER